MADEEQLSEIPEEETMDVEQSTYVTTTETMDVEQSTDATTTTTTTDDNASGTDNSPKQEKTEDTKKPISLKEKLLMGKYLITSCFEKNNDIVF